MDTAEHALQGLEDIRAFLEALWLRDDQLHVTVTLRQVRRYVQRADFPARRLADGPYLARPSEVEAWWRRSRTRPEADVEVVTKGREGSEGK